MSDSYTTKDFVEALEPYPVGVTGLPDDIDPRDAADRLKDLEIPLQDPRIDKDPESLFKGLFPKFIHGKNGDILFELDSYSHHPLSPGFPLKICKPALDYLNRK